MRDVTVVLKYEIPAIRNAFELIRPENYSALCKSGLKQMRP